MICNFQSFSLFSLTEKSCQEQKVTQSFEVYNLLTNLEILLS